MTPEQEELADRYETWQAAGFRRKPAYTPNRTGEDATSHVTNRAVPVYLDPADLQDPGTPFRWRNLPAPGPGLSNTAKT